MEQLPETRIALLESKHRTLMDKLDDFKFVENEHHEEIKQIILEFKDDIHEQLKGKANVWVEKAFSYVLYTVGGIILTALMYLIIIK